MPLRRKVRDIGGWTRGAVHQTENGICASTLGKAVSNAGRADGPAVIRLMAGEAGPPIGSKVLEERIVLGECLSVGLERCDRTTRIPVNFKFWNNIRCRLDPDL